MSHQDPNYLTSPVSGDVALFIGGFTMTKWTQSRTLAIPRVLAVLGQCVLHPTTRPPTHSSPPQTSSLSTHHTHPLPHNSHPLYLRHTTSQTHPLRAGAGGIVAVSTTPITIIISNHTTLPATRPYLSMLYAPAPMFTTVHVHEGECRPGSYSS